MQTPSPHPPHPLSQSDVAPEQVYLGCKVGKNHTKTSAAAASFVICQRGLALYGGLKGQSYGCVTITFPALHLGGRFVAGFQQCTPKKKRNLYLRNEDAFLRACGAKTRMTPVVGFAALL